MPWSDQTGRIMKKPEEYSKNPNTIRARARKARLDPYTREVEQAKASDSKAVTRAWNLHSQSEKYRNGTAAVRKAMLAEVEEEVMQRRRSKGYDANSKIERFVRLNSTQPSTTPSVSGSSVAMNGYESTPGPHGFMQPTASMHPTTPFTGQNGRFATPGSYFGHHMPSVEAHRVFTPYGGPGSHNNKVDAASEAVTKAGLQSKVKMLEAQHEDLEKAVQSLTTDLVLAKATLGAQEIRMNQLEERIQVYHGTASGLSGAEAEFVRQAGKLREIGFGVQRITGVAAEVCASLANGNHDYVGADSVDDTIIRDHQTRAALNGGGINGIKITNGTTKAFHGPNNDVVNGKGAQLYDADMANAENGESDHTCDEV